MRVSTCHNGTLTKSCYLRCVICGAFPAHRVPGTRYAGAAKSGEFLAEISEMKGALGKKRDMHGFQQQTNTRLRFPSIAHNKQLPHLSSVAESVKSVPLEIAIYLSVMLLLHSSSDRKVLSCSAIDRVILMMLSGRIHKSPPPQKRLVNAGFNTTILVPVR